MKKLQHIVSFLLVLCMLMSFFTVSVFAENGDEIGEQDIVVEKGAEALQNVALVKDVSANELDKPFEVYTALGDSIAAAYNTRGYIENAGSPNIVVDGTTATEGSYVKLLGDELAGKTNQCARCAWRTTDILRAFKAYDNDYDSTISMVDPDDWMYSSLWMVSNKADLKARAQSMIESVKEANLITVNFGANDIFTYALMNIILGAFGAIEGPEIDLDVFGKINPLEAKSIEELMVCFAAMLQVAEDATALMQYFDDKCAEGLANFKRDFPQVIQKIRENNKNAKIVIVGMDNPVKFGVQLPDGSYLNFNLIGDKYVLAANAFVQSYCSQSGEYQYADVYGAPYYGITSLDLGQAGEPVKVTGISEIDASLGPIFALVRVVHPDEDGQRFIYERLSNAIRKSINVSAPQLEVTSTLLGNTALNWNIVKGAYSYRVYRSLSPDKGYHLIALTPLSEYVDLLAVSGRMCYYKVVAVMNWGGTISSASVGCDIPPQPVVVAVRAVNAVVSKTNNALKSAFSKLFK